MESSKKKVMVLVITLIIVILGFIYFFIIRDNKYIITMDLNNGSANINTIKVDKGSTIGEIKTPIKNGYKFLYWTSEGKIVDSNTKISKDMKLVAVWENIKQTITVTLDNDGGIGQTNIEIESGSVITNLPNPTKKGYKFSHWELNGKSFDINTQITENITLKAIWTIEEAKKYTVIFNTDGGSEVKIQNISENSIISKPSNPTKKGYEFVSWQLDGKDYNFESPVTSNITLTATWKKAITYTITFNSNGGSNVAQKTVTEGSKVTKPSNPTKSGYTFVSWQLDGKDYNFNTTVTKNITLVASWKKIVAYNVTFNSNGGSSVSSKTVTEGSTVSKPSNPTKSGYTFVNWQLDGKNYDFNTKVTKNITLVATWRKIENYIVTFNSNGGSSVASKTVTEGSTVSKPSDPIKNGYTFDGWLLNGKVYNFSNGITSNITLVAKWNAKTYVIEATKVDAYSPTAKLTIKENGKVISNAKVCSNGVALNSMTIAESLLPKLNCVILSDGTQMPATVR